MSALKLIVDVYATPEGRIEGQTRTPGGPAVPFSGRLELLRAIEDAVATYNEAAPLPGPLGDQEQPRRNS